MMSHVPKWRRLGLRSRLLLYVILPLVCFLLGASYLVLKTMETRGEARMKQHVELIARAIRLPLSYALEHGREESIRTALDSAFRLDQVYGAYVYDSDGNKIAAAGREDLLPEPGRLSRLAEEGSRKGEFGQVAGRNVFSYFVPLTDTGERTIGLLQVTRRAKDFRTYIQSLRRRILLLLIATIAVVSALVLYGHHRAIGNHLSRFENSIARIRRGDRSHRIIAQAPKEVAQLAEEFNSMLDGLQKAQSEITERARQQMALEQSLRQAEKLAAVGEFAAGIAHELGTPLSIIYGIAQRGRRDAQLTPAQHRALLDVETEVKRMEAIIQQLLDFGRAHTLQLREVCAETLARAAARTFTQSCAEVKVDLQLKGAQPAPRVKADPSWIERVLINLLKNAADAGKGGDVLLSWNLQPPYVVFSVEDEGPGVEEGLAEKIFEPFFTTKAVGSGTGLGLSLVDRMVKEHQGELRVGRSELGGAKFEIFLPAGAEDSLRERVV